MNYQTIITYFYTLGQSVLGIRTVGHLNLSLNSKNLSYSIAFFKKEREIDSNGRIFITVKTFFEKSEVLSIT